MRKTYYRYFAGFLRSQERWLNGMAKNGLRLANTGMLAYEFDPCEPGAYEYCVEYVGHKSQSGAESYKAFLEQMGYRALYKNINLNYAVGKVYLRPYAEPGGRIGTSGTTLNKELLIVEKKADGKPFELHTTTEDRITYTKHLRNPRLFISLTFLICGIATQQFAFFIPALLLAIPVAFYQFEIFSMRRASSIRE